LATLLNVPETADSLDFAYTECKKYLKALHEAFISGNRMKSILTILYANTTIGVVQKGCIGQLCIEFALNASYDSCIYEEQQPLHHSYIAICGDMMQNDGGTIRLRNNEVIEMPPWTYTYRYIDKSKSTCAGFWIHASNTSIVFLLLYDYENDVVCLVEPNNEDGIRMDRRRIGGFLQKYYK
jgi:hypothetical protein